MPQMLLDLEEHTVALLAAAAEAADLSKEQVAAEALVRGLALLLRGQNTLWISTPVSGLLRGVTRGEVTVGHALEHGDFGLGTLDQLDGELIVLGGRAYQLSPEGDTREVAASEATPFISVTQFREAQATRVEIPEPLAYSELLDRLQDAMPSPNLFYAVKIVCSFSAARTRSVRRLPPSCPQSPRGPAPGDTALLTAGSAEAAEALAAAVAAGGGDAGGRAGVPAAPCGPSSPKGLAAAVAQQVVFDLGHGSGTLAGFWCPDFLGSGLTVPGYHLHMLADDRKSGGHLLSIEVEKGTAFIQPLHAMETLLPYSVKFAKADLNSKRAAEELERLEK